MTPEQVKELGGLLAAVREARVVDATAFECWKLAQHERNRAEYRLQDARRALEGFLDALATPAVTE